MTANYELTQWDARYSGSVLRGARSWLRRRIVAWEVRRTAGTQLSAAAAEALFVQAVCDNSNLELDWLWLATKLVREHEKRYCWEQALRINPRSEAARRELAALPPLPAHISRITGSPV